MKLKKIHGFTLIETIIAITVFLIFLGMVTLNILNIEPRSANVLNTSTIIADIKTQQLKAMTGATFNSLTSNFGIFFETDKYTLFAGDSYQEGHASNVVITLPINTTLSNTAFPGGTIIFLKNSGEINNFVNGANTLTFNNSISNESKTIIFNKLGVITDLN